MAGKSAPQPKSGAPGSARRAAPARAAPAGLTVVGIGASAGGLDACRKLLDALPADTGMAFILVQHLDPAHESMMVDLLASHTRMAVRQAAEGMAIEADHVYVIPPGKYLSVGEGALHLSQPAAPHGARLPFDFLLHSLARAFKARVVCIVLSGTGADGSLGLRSVKEAGGFVIAQDPKEAAYDGMPRSAVQTGLADLALPIGKIPAALADYRRKPDKFSGKGNATTQAAAPDFLHEIINLLRARTTHDFTLYKPGTLVRRIGRRMALAAIEGADMGRYLAALRVDPKELDLLAKDLLINVTSFFRDSGVFEHLERTVIPALVASHMSDQPLRIWIAGCSTGEETYSLAILFREAIAAANSSVKLQLFASDVDADAVAGARAGIYPESIKADVSEARLARFFVKEDHGFRVMPELRSCVVFTVQDVLADPPFSRLDMISCRNLLIYLGAEAQAKVISAFHFALREGGILLLGGSESVGSADGRFESVSKAERLYRRIGRSRPHDFGAARLTADAGRTAAQPGQKPALTRHSALAELCRRLVMEAFAPAAVLINARHECLYFLGPADRYLRVAAGHPTHDLLAMAPQGLRNKLRSAIQQASQAKGRIAVSGGRVKHSGGAAQFNIDVRPVVTDGEELLLVCFVDAVTPEGKPDRAVTKQDAPQVAELELELEATRTELQSAIRNLELSGEEQRAVNEEALSLNEEFQSTNEELLTSKEELQSLNEELTALNTQLQETLERQRTTSNDLQNILYSTDVATLFLDRKLNIRFFTPATKSLFNVISGDIGRPLSDLNSLSADSALTADALAVLKSFSPIEREIETRSGVWFIRRILPYRTHDNGVEGVVITFTDISERKRIANALETAKRQADVANAAKSRFLAAASHDLRQPLQTLALLQGLLAKSAEGEKAQRYIARFDDTLGAMSGMLNTLLDINQIDSGTVRAEIVSFPVNALLDRLRGEFSYQAQAQKLGLRLVPCGLTIQSDPRLLEQMIRNLLSNALKYTKGGKVLFGCRRRKAALRIEIWDTGIGIAENEIQAIFDEYHQLDNAARERSRGLGLGLSIVQRLGKLLGHQVSVRSRPGRGSVFSIDVPRAAGGGAATPGPAPIGTSAGGADAGQRKGSILVIEDDPEVRELLTILLKSDGHQVSAVADGTAALDCPDRELTRHDLIIADFNLPNGMNGVEVTRKLREKLRRRIPVIILTGDISTAALRAIAQHDCVQINKPVKIKALQQEIGRQLALAPARPAAPALRTAAGAAPPPMVYVVDDDSNVCDAIRAALEEDGRRAETYSTCEAFLEAWRPGETGCLLIDAYLPGMKGVELLRRLRASGHTLPAIVITGSSDVAIAVDAMKAGASDFIEKPIGHAELLASIDRALEQARDANKLAAWRGAAADRIAVLTLRQREVMDLVLAGHPSKNIAADLGISQRTVETHRASIMKKTGAESLPALVRLALAAASGSAGPAAGAVRQSEPDAATPRHKDGQPDAA